MVMYPLSYNCDIASNPAAKAFDKGTNFLNAITKASATFYNTRAYMDATSSNFIAKPRAGFFTIMT